MNAHREKCTQEHHLPIQKEATALKVMEKLGWSVVFARKVGSIYVA